MVSSSKPREDLRTMKFSLLTFTAIVPLVSAHFKLMYPTSRGFDEDLERSREIIIRT
jgi:hypothetical protein